MDKHGDKRLKKRPRAAAQEPSAAAGAAGASGGGAAGAARARLVAFHARMFDVDAVSASSASSSAALSTPVAEDDAAPQLATIKKNGLVGRALKRFKAAMAAGGGGDDDVAMPRVTIRAKTATNAARSAPVAASPAKVATPVTRPASRAHVVRSAVSRSSVDVGDVSAAYLKYKQKKTTSTAAAGIAVPAEKTVKKKTTMATATSEENAARTSALRAGVVTQEELARMSGIVSLEAVDPFEADDPLESAMKAVKEQMAIADSPVATKPRKARKAKTTRDDEAAVPVAAAPAVAEPADSTEVVNDEVEKLSRVGKANLAKKVKVAEASNEVALKDGHQQESDVTKPTKVVSEANSRAVGGDDAGKLEQEARSEQGAPVTKSMSKAQKKERKKKKLAATKQSTPKAGETSDPPPTESPTVQMKEESTAMKQIVEESGNEVDALAASATTAAKMKKNVAEKKQSATKRAAVATTGAESPVKQPKVETPVAAAVLQKHESESNDGSGEEVDALAASSTTAVKRKQRLLAKKQSAAKRVTALASETESPVKQSKTKSGVDEVEAKLVEEESGEESAGELDLAVFNQERIFSNLIDEAARQQWELLEVGRLVKLFAGQWGLKKKRTTRFLCKYCPELVNVDFIEGLGIELRPKQLVKIFERGSGNAVVLMNKLASALENGNLTVRDAAFVQCIVKRVQRMATNVEVLEFLAPLFESLSTVRDVGQLLKQVCQDWHLERSASLVQQILLSAVFDDLDGNQDEILKDLPELTGKLDFPSRLDQEDADEHGNLIGLIANEGSDLGEESGASDDEAEDALGEIESEDEEMRGSDEDEDEEPYEGETDSEEERAIRAQHRPKRRSRFILDEADEESEGHASDEDADESEAETKENDELVSEESSSESESDSEDESWRSKPKSAPRH